ncbi:hypothetical protein EM595_2815 [Duffyella gerundensis]|uniref:Uncharacterized protein n=1 Tax=Duffyella gerundensis TaxID=1619313 RepID=A0A0U5L8F0_9GAMM|nr:hypothetical protein EM595_2815 [Duffyella gerundensis]
MRRFEMEIFKKCGCHANCLFPKKTGEVYRKARFDAPVSTVKA